MLKPTSDSEEKATKMPGTKQRRSGETFLYHPGSNLVQGAGAVLDHNHTHFILVDDGTKGSGSEILFREKFEQYLMQNEAGGTKIPGVLLVVGGSLEIFIEVLKVATTSMPCVIIKGSGGAADLLAYAYSHADKILELDEDGKQHEGLVNATKRFSRYVGINFATLRDYPEFITENCIKKKHLYTIADMQRGMGTADAIMTSVLNHTPSHYEQMQLAIIWDRGDLAETRFMSSYWKPSRLDLILEKEGLTDKEREAAATQHELRELMIMALTMDKVSFVKLLLGYGVNLKSLLTKQILQYLYAYRLDLGFSKLSYELKTEAMVNPNSEYARLFENLQELAGTQGSQESKAQIQEIKLEEVRKLFCNLLRRIPENIIENVFEISEERFRSPFGQLFIWAVFNNMLDMALLFWELENDAICMALIAAEMTNGLIENIRLRDLRDEVEKSMEVSFNTYRKVSHDLLDCCYKTHEKTTELLITMRLNLFNEQFSCLDLAVASDYRDFVSHDCVQGILDDVWTGSITQKNCGRFKVCTFILCPFLLFNSKEIRSKREMKNMIQCAHSDESDEGTKLTMGKKVEEQQLDRMDSAERGIEIINNRKQLPFIKKLYYFHFYSPVVRFYMHTMGYLLFLMLFAHIATLKKAGNVPTGLEILLIITVVGYAVSEVHQLLSIDASSAELKFKGYIDNIWNQFDIACLLVFIIAVILRCIPSTVEYGHLFYAFDVSLWIIRLMHILYANPVAGPYVVMIGHMFIDLMNFIMILIIFLLAYGIAVKGILEPTDNAQIFVGSIFKPYFHWHGEYFLDTPEDKNTTYFGTEKHNSYAEPIALIYMAVYLLIVNILLLNLVIAIFNSTYERIMADATRVSRFLRYGLIMEYARRSVFWPPFSLVFHFYLLIRWLLSLCSCTRVKPYAIKTSLKMQERIGKQKRKELRELESNCLIKLCRKRRRVDASLSNGTDRESSMIDMEDRLVENFKEGLEMLREEKKREPIDEEMELLRQSLDETLATQKDELKTLIQKKITAEIEAKLEEENSALKKEIQKLQIDNNNYLHDIEEKMTLLREKDKKIKELEEENEESHGTSGLEY